MWEASYPFFEWNNASWLGQHDLRLHLVFSGD